MKRFIILCFFGLGCSSSTEGAPAQTTDSGVTPITETSVAADSATADMGNSSDALSCEPDPMAWSPVWHAPSGMHQGKCTAMQVDQLISRLFSASSAKAAVDAFAKDFPECAACAVGSVNADASAPILDYPDYKVLDSNIGGCVALKLGDSSATGCGAKVQAREQCELAACLTCINSTVVDALSCMDLVDADPTLCKSQAQAADACVAANKDAVAECMFDAELRAAPTNATQKVILRRYVTLFCGAPAMADAGSD